MSCEGNINNPEPQRKPVNTYRAVRQFERFFGGRVDLNGPGCERMISEEYQTARMREMQIESELESDPDGEGKLFATSIFDPETGEIKWER